MGTFEKFSAYFYAMEGWQKHYWVYYFCVAIPILISQVMAMKIPMEPTQELNEQMQIYKQQYRIRGEAKIYLDSEIKNAQGYTPLGQTLREAERKQWADLIELSSPEAHWIYWLYLDHEVSQHDRIGLMMHVRNLIVEAYHRRMSWEYKKLFLYVPLLTLLSYLLVWRLATRKKRMLPIA